MSRKTEPMNRTHSATKKRLDTVLAFMGAGLNAEYAGVNAAIAEFVKEHYKEVYEKCRYQESLLA